MGRRRENTPSCCLCLDVRTGTVLIGIWHLLGQLFFMLLIGSFMMQPMTGGEYELMEDDIFHSPHTPHSLSDYCVALVIVFCYFVITMILIKGAIEYRSGLLLPFFCLQLFDFFITLLTSFQIMSYYPEFQSDVGRASFPHNQEFMEWKNTLPADAIDIESRWFIFVALALFLGIMTLKLYCIVCIWACYQHIAAVEVRGPRGWYEEDPELMQPLHVLPPAYADALKDSKEKPPPPPYFE